MDDKLNIIVYAANGNVIGEYFNVPSSTLRIGTSYATCNFQSEYGRTVYILNGTVVIEDAELPAEV